MTATPSGRSRDFDSFRKRALVVVGAGVLLITTAAFVRAPLLPDMGRDLRLGAAGLGGVVSFFALGRILADVPVGRLTDRHPAGLMLAAGAAIVAAGSVVSAAAPGAIVAYVGAFVLGVGSAWTNTTGLAAFADAPRHRRGTSMSGFAAALLVGQAIGPMAGGGIAAAGGWRIAFASGAAIAFAAAAGLVAVFVRMRRSGIGAQTDAAPVRQNHVPRRVLAVLYLLPATQFAIGAALIQTLVPIVADAELGMGAGTIGLAIGLGGLLRLVGAVTSGQIADRFSRRWGLFPGLMLQVAGLVVFAAMGTTEGWLAAIALTSLGSSSVNVGATVLADLSEGGALGRRLGLFRLTGDVALFVAPLVSGALYDASGRLLATLPLVAFVVAVVILALAIVPDTTPGPRP